jgi:serine protease
MSRRLSVFLLLIFTTTTALAETQRYLVQTRRPARDLRVTSMSIDLEARNLREFQNFDAFAVDLTAEEAAAMKQARDVIVVEPVVDRYLQSTRRNLTAAPHAPRPPGEMVPWGIDAINPRMVWSITKGSKNVHVAVVDTGIDMTHPELKDSYVGGHNFFYPELPPRDDNGHGTHVAGTIAAAHNGQGVVGIAPNVSIWALKILDLTGWGTSEQVVQAMDWLIAKKKEIGGVWVANLSVGSERPSEVERQAVVRAQDAGIVLIAAAGNTGWTQIIYPAGYRNVIAVGAINEERKVPEWSTYGLGITIVAPGEGVDSTLPQGLFSITEINAQPEEVKAYKIGNSPFGTVTGKYVECGYGRSADFPVSVTGNIALIKRGPRGDGGISFYQKAQFAKRSGAIAAVIYNDDDVDRRDFHNWTFGDREDVDMTSVIPTVAVSNEDGAKLLRYPDLTKGITVSHESEDYAVLDGTSMATPHVTGTVALMLSLNPSANLAQITTALQKTTTDVEGKGWDFKSGWGLIDTYAAAKAIAPGVFGTTNPDLANPRRRSVRQ